MLKWIWMVAILFFGIVNACQEELVDSFESCVNQKCAINYKSEPPRTCTTQYTVYEETSSKLARSITTSCDQHKDCLLYMPDKHGLRCCDEEACDQLNHPNLLFTKRMIETVRAVNRDTYSLAHQAMCHQFWNNSLACQHPENRECMEHILNENFEDPRLYDTIYGEKTLRIYCDLNTHQCQHAVVKHNNNLVVLHPILISIGIIILGIIAIWLVVNGFDAIQVPHLKQAMYNAIDEFGSDDDDESAFDDLFDAPEMDMMSLSDEEERVS